MWPAACSCLTANFLFVSPNRPGACFECCCDDVTSFETCGFRCFNRDTAVWQEEKNVMNVLVLSLSSKLINRTCRNVLDQMWNGFVETCFWTDLVCLTFRLWISRPSPHTVPNISCFRVTSSLSPLMSNITHSHPEAEVSLRSWIYLCERTKDPFLIFFMLTVTNRPSFFNTTSGLSLTLLTLTLTLRLYISVLLKINSNQESKYFLNS